jgi:predicted 3-demethylubiquinone-9 3-methyltransferase (glyoxalase superfamily)
LSAPTNQKLIGSPGDYPDGKAGDVLPVEFTLAANRYTALKGGPIFKFKEAVSLQIDCEDPAEVDRLTEALSPVPEAGQYGGSGTATACRGRRALCPEPPGWPIPIPPSASACSRP